MEQLQAHEPRGGAPPAVTPPPWGLMGNGLAAPPLPAMPGGAPLWPVGFGPPAIPAVDHARGGAADPGTAHGALIAHALKHGKPLDKAA
jgi:hypothetical protein